MIYLIIYIIIWGYAKHIKLNKPIKYEIDLMVRFGDYWRIDNKRRIIISFTYCYERRRCGIYRWKSNGDVKEITELKIMSFQRKVHIYLI